MKLLVATLLLLLATHSKGQYNFESCIAFWKLTDQLKKGIEPSDAEWLALRETEGYKRKNISDQRWKEFTNKIKFAFAPGNYDSLVLKAATDLSFRHIIEYVREEAHLKQYVKNLDQRSFDSTIASVKKLLPNEYQNCFLPPVIFFALWDYDGSATAGYVCVDLLISWHMSTFKPGIFEKHELYHNAVAACRIKTRRFKRNPAKEDQGIFILVNSLSTEGTADLIDKEWVVFNQQSPYLHKDTFSIFSDTQAPQYLEKINEGLEKIYDKKTKPYSEISFWMQLVPWAAHIPGTYMSQVIKRNGLEQQAFEQTGNSFQFFYLYNEAAIADAAHPPVFSKKAIKLLKKLERKYIR